MEQVEIPDLKISSLLPSLKGNRPTNVLGGLNESMKNVSYGVAGSVAVLIGAPIKLGSDGYSAYGVCGAIGGGLLGGLVGGLATAGILSASLLYSMWQLGGGLVRTPATTYHSLQGKHWDRDAEEWNFYDLEIDSEHIMKGGEDDFLARYAASQQKSAAQLFSINQHLPQQAKTFSFFPSLHPATSLSSQDASIDINEDIPIELRPKKSLKDRELYDLLGVEPEATLSEIKKAYYVKARKCHPDRNPNDPQAKLSFQRIGQAYQILGDEKLRQDYDSRGKAVMDKHPGIDAGMLYTLLFGSEHFESLIGELKLATMVKLSTEKTSPEQEQIPNRTQVLQQYRQRKRELDCAKQLIAKLEYYMNGEKEVFRDKMEKECDEILSGDNLMSALLLSYVGQVYRDRALMHCQLSRRMADYLTTPFRGMYKSTTMLFKGSQTIWSALKLQRLHKEAKQLQKEEDEKNGTSAAQDPMAMNLNVLYGPNATEERKQLVHDTTKNVTRHTLSLLWDITKQDVRNTLKSVCFKILNDHSVTETTRNARAEALLQLGNIYCRKAVNEGESLEELLTKLGRQSGLFDADDLHEKARRGRQGDGEENDEEEDHAKRWKELRQRLVNAKNGSEAAVPIKELKASILDLGGDPSGCIERSDLEQKLMELLDKNLATNS